MTSVTDTDQALGGKPSKGTSKDKRLKRKAPAMPMPNPLPTMPAMSTADLSPEDLAAIVEFIDTLTKAPADAQAVPSDVPQGRPFSGLMMVEGMETSDGRMMELGSTTWRDVPLPLMVQDTSSHGPGQTPAPAWAAGQIENIWRDEADPSRIMCEGHLMANDAGQRAQEIIQGAFRGVSIDGYGDSPLPAIEQPTAVDQDGNPISVLTRYADTVITRLTLVPTPAFAAACVWLDGETMPMCAQDAHGAMIDTEAEPEVVAMPPNAYEMLVASGGGPLHPPKSFFFQPEPERRQEIILQADGSFCGHIFGKGECHTAYSGVCEMAPMSRTVPPFVAFHRTEVHCDDGAKLACGWIPINTNHSKISHGRREAEDWSQDQTWEHYENSGTLIAKARASNGRYGVWLSGCLLPGLGDRELAIAQGLSVSGHWNVYQDPRTKQRYPDELLALLGGVPQPGYPETRVRPELLVASGEVIGHISPFAEDCCDDCDEEGEPMSASDIARIDRLEKVVSVLYAAAPKEVRASLNGDGEAFAVKEPADEVSDAPDVLADVAVVLVEQGEWEALSVTALSTAERARWYAKYDKAARDKAAASGHALPDGSYIVEDGEDLKAAIRAVGRGSNNSHNVIRKHVMKNAARLGMEKMIPPTWQADGSLKASLKTRA